MIETLMNAMSVAGAEWVLWLLFGLSAVSVVIIVERILFMARRRVDIDSLTGAALSLVDSGRWDEAMALLKDNPSMEAQVGHRVMADASAVPWALEDVYKAAVERERLRYEQRVGFLATLGSNAPFIGLFGTVLGIIGAFADLGAAAAGAGRAQIIMGSISEALVATAVGLLVAIPAVVAYNALQRKVDDSVASTEVLVRQLMARFRVEA